jgi:hypothetical protein
MPQPSSLLFWAQPKASPPLLAQHHTESGSGAVHLLSQDESVVIVFASHVTPPVNSTHCLEPAAPLQQYDFCGALHRFASSDSPHALSVPGVEPASHVTPSFFSTQAFEEQQYSLGPEAAHELLQSGSVTGDEPF